MKTYVLNTPVITNYGVFKFEKIDIENAKKLLKSSNFISAVGHKGTADIMSRLFGVEIPNNRVAITMQPGDQAIVFRLLVRMEEGRVLSMEDLKNLPYEIALLTMLDGDGGE